MICFPSPRNSTALNVDVSHSDQWLMLDITKYFVSSPYVLSCWCGGGKRITTYTRHGLNARFGKSVMFFITLLTEGKKRGNYWSEKIKKKKKKIKSRTHPTSHIPFYAQQQKAEKSVRGVWGLLEQKYWPAVLPRSLPKKKKKKTAPKTAMLQVFTLATDTSWLRHAVREKTETNVSWVSG